MSKWIKRAGWAAAGLFVVGSALVLGALAAAEWRMTREVGVPKRPVAIRADPASVERGRYLFASRGCADCHGPTGAGRTFLDDGGLRVRGPNITPGPGGAVARYLPEDWDRTIRHGVHPSGRPLMIMPSEDYNRWSDDDLAALVAYVRQMPPASGGGALVELPLPVRALYGLGFIKDAAAKIDHSLPPAAPVPEGISLEHGKYVANMCLGCHGPRLEGGRIPGGPPDWPPASRLAAGEGSVMAARYATVDPFLQMLRTGKRPDGTAIKVMPFEAFAHMSDVDARALHLYLSNLR
jgi:mono/diheme cytochrome c family protein